MLGEVELSNGAGLFVLVTVKVVPAEVTAPGLVTVTAGVPAVVTSVERIDAVSCVEFWNDVAFAAPLKFTTEPFTKFVPLTVSVNAPEPAVVVVGLIVVSSAD